jgi:hypothetical protein
LWRVGKLRERLRVKTLKTIDKGHGQIERRKYIYSTDIDWMQDAKKSWAGLCGIEMICRGQTTMQ